MEKMMRREESIKILVRMMMDSLGDKEKSMALGRAVKDVRERDKVCRCTGCVHFGESEEYIGECAGCSRNPNIEDMYVEEVTE